MQKGKVKKQNRFMYSRIESSRVESRVNRLKEPEQYNQQSKWTKWHFIEQKEAQSHNTGYRLLWQNATESQLLRRDKHKQIKTGQ